MQSPLSDLMDIFSGGSESWSDDESWPVRYVKDGEYDIDYTYDMEDVRRHRARRHKQQNLEMTFSRDSNSILEEDENLNETSSTNQSTSYYSSDGNEGTTATTTDYDEQQRQEMRDRVLGVNPFESPPRRQALPPDHSPSPPKGFRPTGILKRRRNYHSDRSLELSLGVTSDLNTVEEESHSSASNSRTPFDERQRESRQSRNYVQRSAESFSSASDSRTPFDERRRESRQSRNYVQQQRSLESVGSLLDNESQDDNRMLPPVQEDSSEQPSDEYALSASTHQAQERLQSMLQRKRQMTQQASVRSAELQLQRELRRAKSDSFSPSDCSASTPSELSMPLSTEERTGSSVESDVFHNIEATESHLALIDLCSEANSPTDVAWRNAIYLLSQKPELATVTEEGWTPLHVACLGNAPPPNFIVKAILFCEPKVAQAVDGGGRLPLHMCAASSAHPSILQLLVQAYPEAVYHKEECGMTPLHMLLKNEDVELTMERVRILLGQTIAKSTTQSTAKKPARLLQRRGQHLELTVDEINSMVDRQGYGPLDTVYDDEEEEELLGYPQDVQECFSKLAQWKRKQKRSGEDSEEVDLELAEPSENQETNPAAIAANMQLPLHMAICRKDPDHRSYLSGDDEDDFDVRNPPPHHEDIIRVLVSAYPRGLLQRNAKGHTPLLMALHNRECLPTLQLLQVLLGMHTIGFETPPPWAVDLPLHQLSDGRYLNPAMVPTVETNQLPLHVAAEEMPSFLAAIESIHSMYPGAILVQDARGRTPLHMALRNYQRIQPDPQVISLLLTDKVAEIRDDDGYLPFDLLVGEAHNLPQHEPTPSTWGDSSFDPSAVYVKFFHFVVAQAPRPRNRVEALRFLERLRLLPPWLRRQACTVPFIQDLLLEEMSSMGKCGLIFLHGMLWVILLTCFRLQLDAYTRFGIQGGYGGVIYTLSTILLICQLISWFIASSLKVFASHCLFNLWTWVDLTAVFVTFGATGLLVDGNSESVATLGTAATGLLWGSLIGFVAKWWYGMSVFMGRTLRMFNVLVWPLIALVILIVAFAQMFYTFHVTASPDTCDEALGGRPLCDIKDAFITVYHMLLWTPLIDTEGESGSSLSPGTVALISFFTALLVLFIISLLISVVTEAMNMDLDDVALGYFWEPKLNFTFIVDDVLSVLPCVDIQKRKMRRGIKQKGKFIHKPSRAERMSSKLGDAWTVIDYYLFGGERRQGRMWYVRYGRGGTSPIVAWPLRLCCLIVLPVWLALGLATCGLLWPPQVRRWVFRPSSTRRKREANAAAEFSATQVSSMRGDVLQLKTMSYQKSNDVKQEIHELKQMLYEAMEE